MEAPEVLLQRNLDRPVKLGHGKLIDIMIHDGLWDSFNDFHMGSAAEYTAAKSKISRERQDEYAAASHAKAVAARHAGKFNSEIVPVPVPQPARRCSRNGCRAPDRPTR